MQQRVLVTGGRGDLAARIIPTFEKSGARVLTPGRDELDVADPGSVDAFFAELEPLDLLIANAGLAENALLARCDEASWDRQLHVNLHGAYRCARAALPDMWRRRSGHIIFISSQSARHPPPGQAAYAAAKAGLLGLARSLAREAGRANIRVNVVLPGFLETRMTEGLPDARREQVRGEHQLGRFNTPEAAAAFLHHLHHQLPHTSGQVFQLDSR